MQPIDCTQTRTMEQQPASRKKTAPGRFFRSPWVSLAVSILSLVMLIRYIRIFTTAEDPGAHLIMLMLWAVLAVVGIATFICQLLPDNK